MKGLELASKVSVTEPYFFGNPEAKYKVAALDLVSSEISCATWQLVICTSKYSRTTRL